MSASKWREPENVIFGLAMGGLFLCALGLLIILVAALVELFK